MHEPLGHMPSTTRGSSFCVNTMKISQSGIHLESLGNAKEIGHHICRHLRHQLLRDNSAMKGCQHQYNGHRETSDSTWQ